MLEGSNNKEKQVNTGRYTKKERAIALSLLTVLSGAQARADQIVLGTRDEATKINVRSTLESTGQLKILDHLTGSETTSSGILRLPNGDVIVAAYNGETGVSDIERVTGINSSNPTVSRAHLSVDMPREISFNPTTSRVAIASQGDSKGLLCDNDLSHCETYTLSSGSQPMFLTEVDGGLLVALNYSGGTASIYDPGVDTNADGFADDADGDGNPDNTPKKVAEFNGLTNPQGAVLIGGNALWVVAHDAKALYVIDINFEAPEASTSTKILNLEFQPHDIKLDPSNPNRILFGGDLSSYAYVVSYDTQTKETITKKYEAGSLAGYYEFISFDSEGNPWITEHNYNLARQIDRVTLDLTGKQVDVGGRPAAFIIVPDAVPIDADSDGYDSDKDCNDTDPAINPGADELCTDEVDEDCDGDPQAGAVDTGTFYPDNDGDLYGDKTSGGVEACDVPPSYTDNNADCDDGSSTTYPGAEEVMDGVDNNCNGEIDEGSSTEDPETPTPEGTATPTEDPEQPTPSPSPTPDVTPVETVTPSPTPYVSGSPTPAAVCDLRYGTITTLTGADCATVGLNPTATNQMTGVTGGPIVVTIDAQGNVIIESKDDSIFTVEKHDQNPEIGIKVNRGSESLGIYHTAMRVEQEGTIGIFVGVEGCATYTNPTINGGVPMVDALCASYQVVSDINTHKIDPNLTTAPAIVEALEEGEEGDDDGEPGGCGGGCNHGQGSHPPVEPILGLGLAVLVLMRRRLKSVSSPEEVQLVVGTSLKSMQQ